MHIVVLLQRAHRPAPAVTGAPSRWLGNSGGGLRCDPPISALLPIPGGTVASPSVRRFCRAGRFRAAGRRSEHRPRVPVAHRRDRDGAAGVAAAATEPAAAAEIAGL